jgi:hypothetical protein
MVGTIIPVSVPQPIAEFIHMSLNDTDLQQAVLEDFKWAFEQLQTGNLKPYQGQHVAIVNRQILGSGNSVTLLDSVCAEHHLDPERVIVMFVDPVP